MSLFSKLFGGGTTDAATDTAASSELYEGFKITPNPMKEGSQWRLAALIEKDGREHQLIRADTIGNKDEADAASVAKAKQMIREQGDRIFG